MFLAVIINQRPSQLLHMLSSDGLCRNDSWVSCLKSLWLDKGVLVGWDELPLVVGASISDDDLGWVLIRHNDGWLWKSAPEGVGVVWLKWLLQHASVEVLSNFVLVLGKSCNFRESLAIEIDWLWSSIIERNADSLPILLQDLAAGSNLGVLEHSCWGSLLILDDHAFPIESLLVLLCFRLLLGSDLHQNFLWNSHFNSFEINKY